MPKTKTKRRKPTVSIIGIGRVGFALANALQSVGYPVIALVVRDWRTVGTFNRIFPKSLLLGSNHLERLPPSDLLLITTPDDAIEETAQRVAALHNSKGRRVVLHTSGALSSEVLSPLTRAGFQVGSIHPLVSVGHYEDGTVFRGAFFCLEGQKVAVAFAQQIIHDFGGKSFSVKPERKALYHAAAVIASPHLVALFDLAVELLTISGVRSDDAQKILLPLVESTVKGLYARDPSLALTGTFARGDVGTVERHLKALSEGKPKPPAEALEVYKLLGLRSLQMAKRRGLDQKKIGKIKKLLNPANPLHGCSPRRRR